ncbi:MAG TPA: hypothetical protein VHS31_13635 [Tepidisphaeraceae bacterium]|jgi:hypothetical protein|nr:hypothetical protein [Tepidisphaeraceae bacterium]
MGRLLRVALLLVEALFFNVIIPGHTRGSIQLPGSPSASCCCESQQSGHRSLPNDKTRTENCAICNFAARLTIPPAIDFAPPPTGLLEILPPPARETIQIASFCAVYFGRAPPICSV